MKLRGFTLIELIMSVAIFLLITTVVGRVFSQSFASYRNTKAIERDVENAQYALNVLAKELKTSTIVTPTTGPTDVQSVKFYDHSQRICFQYRISAGVFQVASQVVASLNDCISATVNSYSNLTSGTVSGHIIVTPSINTDPKRIGKVTVSLQISEGANHTARIQSTMSLRDYGYVGLQ